MLLYRVGQSYRSIVHFDDIEREQLPFYADKISRQNKTDLLRGKNDDHNFCTIACVE